MKTLSFTLGMLAFGLLTAASPPAHAGSWQTAAGYYRFTNADFSSIDGTWRKNLGNIGIRLDYVTSTAYHGSSVTSRARIGAKERAASNAIQCMGQFQAYGANNDPWNAACVGDYIRVFDTPSMYPYFDMFAFNALCTSARSLALQSGKSGPIRVTAKVELWGDAAGTEGDDYIDTGSISGECYY